MIFYKAVLSFGLTFCGLILSKLLVKRGSLEIDYPPTSRTRFARSNDNASPNESPLNSASASARLSRRIAYEDLLRSATAAVTSSGRSIDEVQKDINRSSKLSHGWNFRVGRKNKEPDFGENAYANYNDAFRAGLKFVATPADPEMAAYLNW